MKRIIALIVALVLALSCVCFAESVEEETDQEQTIEKKYARLEELFNIIMDNYYIEVDEETLMQGAIDGMLAALDDPYTFFYTKEDMDDQRESATGEYKGVGMSVSMDGQGAIKVIRVFEDSPADKAGILSGDILTEIDGDKLDIQNEKDLDEAVTRLRGVDESDVVLTMIRNGEEIKFTVTRGDVNINYVEYQMIDEICYVQLYQFEQTTAQSFMKAQAFAIENNAQGLIIDLRDNPGGMLDSVVNIADALLEKGRIVYTVDRAGTKTTYYSSDGSWDIPLVILINGNSASASEILSAAVKDYGRGTLVGTTSFGKGIVQLLMTFDDGTGMQYTESNYYTPSGASIHKVGVEPDIVVELSEDYDPSIRTIDLDNDNQLAAAVEEVRRLIAEKE